MTSRLSLGKHAPATARQRLRLRRLAIDAVLVSLALVLSIIERWIPLDLIVPVPGIKLGLANIVTLFALLRMRPLDAGIILLVRSLAMVAITGPVTLLFSLTGGFLALLLMWLLSCWEGRTFSVIGISLAGAAAHNIGQVAVAGLILNEPLLLLTYLPPLLLTSLATGTLTGIAAYPVVRRFPSLLSDPKAPPPRPPASPPILPLRFLLALVTALAMLPQILFLSGCQNGLSAETTTPDGYRKYSYEFSGTFDTVIQFIGYTRNEAGFASLTRLGEKRFRELHQLFDAYQNYPGLNNVKTINDQAGQKPVQVAADLLQLIRKSMEWNRTISGKTNIALGKTILLWQSYREKALEDPAAAAVPTGAELAETLAHTDLNKIIVDEAAGTVYLADPEMRLDVGAVAKGYATELVAQDLIAAGADSLIINAGGSNVCLIGQPRGDRETWNVGLQNPEALLPDAGQAAGPGKDAGTAAAEPDLAAILHARNTSVVTSGDYQRYYLVGDKVYHHLIDPVDGIPTDYCRAVTVVTPDSGLADFLSTALFLLPYEQSRALADSLPDVQVLWIFAGRRLEMTAGLAEWLDVP
jgi:FAD:protein FMN transferase